MWQQYTITDEIEVYILLITLYTQKYFFFVQRVIVLSCSVLILPLHPKIRTHSLCLLRQSQRFLMSYGSFTHCCVPVRQSHGILKRPWWIVDISETRPVSCKLKVGRKWFVDVSETLAESYKLNVGRKWFVVLSEKLEESYKLNVGRKWFVVLSEKLEESYKLKWKAGRGSLILMRHWQNSVN